MHVGLADLHKPDAHDEGTARRSAVANHLAMALLLNKEGGVRDPLLALFLDGLLQQPLGPLAKDRRQRVVGLGRRVLARSWKRKRFAGSFMHRGVLLRVRGPRLMQQPQGTPPYSLLHPHDSVIYALLAAVVAPTHEADGSTVQTPLYPDWHWVDLPMAKSSSSVLRRSV